ncbi:hypothetical protein FRX31_004283 [Thalictrum thalictroides]|uniref:Uncharacterized protein n=1 Tax=Thalictrum thalictroides TaxID=46969 RepID=A0A7J6XB25_THATH|nr:hypothetical protein FRX31_004283 [Thalictrum thalictroides]
MELKKRSEHSGVGNGGGFQTKEKIVANGSNTTTTTTTTADEPIDDHWAFLEEIDAPMWADLSLESKSIDQDINASWFEVVHPFHQLSSLHFLAEGKVKSDAELLELSSPGLPLSVSKSRGKHYKSRKWRADKLNVSVGKHHPIQSFKAKGSLGVPGSCQEVKPKIKNSSGNPKCTSRVKGKLVRKGSAFDATRPISLNRNPNLQNPKIIANLKASLVEYTSNDGRDPITGRVKPSFRDSKITSCVTESCSGDSNSNSTSRPNTLKYKLSLVDSRTSNTITSNAPQSKSSLGDSEWTSRMTASSIGCGNSASHNLSDSSKRKPSSGEIYVKLKSSTASESILHESHTVSDFSQQIIGQTNGLLSAIRMSRRSYVTRQPQRVEVQDKRQSKDRKSSSSKSSVGSTTNSGCNFKNAMLTSIENRNRTPESMDVRKGEQPTRQNKAEAKNVNVTCAGQSQVHSFNPKKEGKATAWRSIGQETLEIKNSCQSDRRKPLQVRNSYTDCPKAKESLVNTKKENVHGVLSQKIASKENNSGSTFCTRKVSKHSLMRKESKVSDAKGKANSRNKSTDSKNVVQRYYFR